MKPNIFGEIHGMQNIADYLLISLTTLEDYRNTGRIRIKKQGGRYYAKVYYLDKWIKRNWR